MCLGAQKNHLNETALLSTQNMFWEERKMILKNAFPNKNP